MCSSLDVARRFGKQHKDVLRSIEAMEISQEVFERNFAPKTYGVKKGRGNGYISQEPYYLMSRRGFSVLVMGFTGKEAMQWKWLYAEAFDKMEETIKAGMKPMSNEEIMARALLLAQETIAEKDKVIEDMTPKAEVFDTLCNSEGLMGLTEALKACNVKPRNGMKFLRDEYHGKVFYATNSNGYMPYQQLIDRGFFVVNERPYKGRSGREYIEQQTMVTPKGQAFLAKIVRKYAWTINNGVRKDW